jgi:diguanylate cyclase (GGDEF)-like protein
VRAALLVFLLCGVLIAAVCFTLDRNARQSNRQQAATELASVAQVAASEFQTMRANLRTRVGELASSARLQAAVLDRSLPRVAAIAGRNRGRIVADGHAVGTLPANPRIAASAVIANSGHVIARVTIAVPIDGSLLAALATATPMPDHAALLFVRHRQIVAGGPIGWRAHLRHASVKLGSVAFDARAAHLGVADTSILAIEPVSAVDARVNAFRRRLLFAAALTLALAAGLATRLGRPVARILGELARLSGQAQTDALTGIANRRALDERLDDEIDHARRLGTNVSFVIADIDDFKSINDRYGHQTGDAVLRAVARAFADAVRELDLVGRFGGEELALVLPGTQLAGARRLAERIRNAVEALRLTTPDGEIATVTASFGAASFPTHSTIEELVSGADTALYEAKRNGKNRVVTATAKKKSMPPATRNAVAPT